MNRDEQIQTLKVVDMQGGHARTTTNNAQLAELWRSGFLRLVTRSAATGMCTYRMTDAGRAFLAAAVGAEEAAARDAYHATKLDYSAPGSHRSHSTWVEAHEAADAAGVEPFTRGWYEVIVRFVKAAELDQDAWHAPTGVWKEGLLVRNQESEDATAWTVVSRQDGQTYYTPTGVEAATREDAEEAAGQLAMRHGPTAPFWHTVTFYAVPSRDNQAYANDPDHLTVGARRWPILWTHAARYTMGGQS